MRWARRGRRNPLHIPVAPVPRARAGRLLDLGEEAGRRRFLDHYALVMGVPGPPGSWGAESYEDPVDRAEVLVPSHRGSDRDGPARIDVVVDVRGPLGAVRSSLWSILTKTGRPFHLVLVDSSTKEPVQQFVHEFVDRHPYVTFVANPDERRRRWKAENVGLHASGGDVVVFLGSGAIASQGWLDGLITCLEDPTCGMAGPLIDVADGPQAFPTQGATGAQNELPAWLTADGMALLLRGGDRPRRPDVESLDRLCRAVRRDVLDQVGDFDADDGYGRRARAAGFRLVVADDAYMQAPVRNQEVTAPTPDGSSSPTAAPGEDPLAELRDRVLPAMASTDSMVTAFRAARPQPLRVSFVMPNMAHGGSGGLHSVYQEASGLRGLGVEAVILANETYMQFARLAYPDADEVFLEFDTDDELERLSRGCQVLVATHFKSVRSLAAVWERRQDFLPAYYVQDYEPFFTVNVNGGAPESLEARSSYDLVDGMLLFAKTHWICNAVGRVRSLPVAKIEPGIDKSLFTASRGCLRPSGPVRVLGMVRPRTWRRQPFATLMLLDRLRADLGDAVEVHSFGCTDEALDLMTGGHRYTVEHHGVLTREQIASRLKETDVFLDVSAFQGMGRTGFEAMCCGCVPVVPRIGGAHEYAINDRNAVFVDSSDLSASYRTLRALVGDRHRIARLQAAGVADGHRRSVLAAVLSEYALLDHEHGRRFAVSDPPPAPRPTSVATSDDARVVRG